MGWAALALGWVAAGVVGTGLMTRRYWPGGQADPIALFLLVATGPVPAAILLLHLLLALPVRLAKAIGGVRDGERFPCPLCGASVLKSKSPWRDRC